MKLTKKDLSDLILEYLEEAETGAELYARMMDKPLPTDFRKEFGKTQRSATAARGWRSPGGIARLFMEKFPGSKKKKACTIIEILEEWEGKNIGEEEEKEMDRKIREPGRAHKFSAGVVSLDPFEEEEENFIMSGINKHLKGKRMEPTSDELKREFC